LEEVGGAEEQNIGKDFFLLSPFFEKGAQNGNGRLDALS
jgi:hypothetical protein